MATQRAWSSIMRRIFHRPMSSPISLQSISSPESIEKPRSSQFSSLLPNNPFGSFAYKGPRLRPGAPGDVESSFPIQGTRLSDVALRLAQRKHPLAPQAVAIQMPLPAEPPRLDPLPVVTGPWLSMRRVDTAARPAAAALSTSTHSPGDTPQPERKFSRLRRGDMRSKPARGSVRARKLGQVVRVMSDSDDASEDEAASNAQALLQRVSARRSQREPVNDSRGSDGGESSNRDDGKVAGVISVLTRTTEANSLRNALQVWVYARRRYFASLVQRSLQHCVLHAPPSTFWSASLSCSIMQGMCMQCWRLQLVMPPAAVRWPLALVTESQPAGQRDQRRAGNASFRLSRQRLRLFGLQRPSLMLLAGASAA
jgi:hypothetical protein